ncbi:MAG: hypothetical protein A3F31_01030 [Candidatus Levybacteria bacterium RIFCSPHIGHO2_12_FULL_38_12]|nr:MAG: hypothetical protein A2770_01660 [Candidatus Levybacteria bacterium RIFCSPHIGHO2_01_FULL_38_12]OGH22003.1 MAG: hypothetical protein A3D75_03190 [Candidatus Levybacteria bacterium RIFCSPHIGHO2_02_FULL_37_18]OGH23074.1 MAG: hypothetical protein A3F31_01030 [Candidatus Levybacteria bacterium RIFCSPHIGHO2_12_FULL_38_12]OGH33696.1 MAG: hypothetical protein A3A47_02625 [Candidatus Levybacteria bacterium RIFCSPLOWO2_01_FULL_37_20]OGH44602.1 MAG: hypothetical protein A3J14_00710 [Candidatus Lev
MQLPLLCIKFWFFEAPNRLYTYFASLNSSLLQLFSLPLLVKTFFKPIKNEYREGLVGFSIVMGMAVKSVLIVVDLLFLFIVLTFELLILLVFLLIPIASIGMLFI